MDASINLLTHPPDGNLVLERFAANLIDFPNATDDLSAGIHPHRKENALVRRYVALNHRLAFYITVDIDRQGAAFAWDDANLPPPTIVSINPVNAHAHLLWELAAPVATTPNARRKPVEYLEATKRAIRDRVGGDMGYAGYLTKNPTHPSWRVITSDRRYDLGEMQEYVDLAPFIAPIEHDALGRNCSLFESLRRWAYRHADRAESFEQWQWQCERTAQALNTFGDPLPTSEVRNTARSVARWTWQHRGSLRDPSEGIMGFAPLPDDLDAETHLVEVCTRQSAAARYTHQTQRRRTATVIESTARALGLDVGALRDRDATRFAIRARLGINTVRRFIANQAAD
jgi:hypothetical protein